MTASNDFAGMPARASENSIITWRAFMAFVASRKNQILALTENELTEFKQTIGAHAYAFNATEEEFEQAWLEILELPQPA